MNKARLVLRFTDKRRWEKELRKGGLVNHTRGCRATKLVFVTLKGGGGGVKRGAKKSTSGNRSPKLKLSPRQDNMGPRHKKA